MSVELLEPVAEAARVAGRVALRSFGKDLAVRAKPDGSDVSDADLAAERALREWITERFPGDGIVGEELGTTNPSAARRWLIDPIDGTTSFLARVPLWGTLVAIAEGDTVLAGAIYCPAVDELVCASLGAGSWRNGARARVSDESRLDRAMVLTSSARSEDQEKTPGVRAVFERSRAARTWGDCYGHLLVATGRAEAMLDPVMNDWDSAALAPIIIEAGGVFTDWSGRATAFGGSAISTNAPLADEIRRIVGVSR